MDKIEKEIKKSLLRIKRPSKYITDILEIKNIISKKLKYIYEPLRISFHLNNGLRFPKKEDMLNLFLPIPHNIDNLNLLDRVEKEYKRKNKGDDIDLILPDCFNDSFLIDYSHSIPKIGDVFGCVWIMRKPITDKRGLFLISDIKRLCLSCYNRFFKDAKELIRNNFY